MKNSLYVRFCRVLALCCALMMLCMPVMAEEPGEDAFADTMVEYMNVELGFTVQYPAAFEEVEMTAEGVSGELKDGTASFYARRCANEQAISLEDWVAAQQEAHPLALLTMNEFTLSARMTHHREDGMFQADMAIVTGEWIYEVQLVYAPAVAPDFALYSDYMLNSLAADELGQG